MTTRKIQQASPQNVPNDRQKQEVLVLDLREKYKGAFSHEFFQKKDAFLNIVRKNEVKYVADIAKNTEQTKTGFQRFQKTLKDAEPDTMLTPVMLCSHTLIETIYTQLVLDALSYHKANWFPVFCAQYDYASGFREIVIDMIRADAMSKSTDKNKPARDIQEAIERVQELWGETPTIDESLAAFHQLQTETRQFKELFSMDPSGMLLLRHLVSRLRQRAVPNAMLTSPTSGLASYQSPAFILAGAEFASLAYQALYTLSAAWMTL